MGHHGSYNYPLLSLLLCVIVLIFQPCIEGSKRTSGLQSGNAFDRGLNPLPGICETAVLGQGYKCKEFEVVTDDGYILSVQRIPEGRVSKGHHHKNKQPILIQHGLFVDAETWFMNDPEQNLPNILADQGFDVWISNTRGVRCSRRHKTLNPNDSKFWNWSWDDVAAHDLPALFDFVYNQTGQKVHYIGHSMGTIIAMAALSEGKLTDKIKSAALLSPISYLGHVSTILGVAASKIYGAEMVMTVHPEFYPKGRPVSDFLKIVCLGVKMGCYDYLSELAGIHCCLNDSTINIFLRNEPQSTSTKNLAHFSQIVRNPVAGVKKYNYGSADFNKKHYGVSEPPSYNFSNIPRDLPLYIGYGGKDPLADPRDVGLLLNDLKSHDKDKLTVKFVKKYAHLDFIMGYNANKVVYNDLIDFFKKN